MKKLLIAHIVDVACWFILGLILGIVFFQEPRYNNGMNDELKEQIRELIIEVLEEREKDAKECERAFDEMMLKDVPPFPSINQELRYNNSMPRKQEYLVEVYDTKFRKVFDIGPYEEEQARDVLRVYKEGGYLVTITEKELIEQVQNKDMTARRLISLLEKIEPSTPVCLDLNPPKSRGMGSAGVTGRGWVDVETIVLKETTKNPNTNRERKDSRIILTTEPS